MFRFLDWVYDFGSPYMSWWGKVLYTLACVLSLGLCFTVFVVTVILFFFGLFSFGGWTWEPMRHLLDIPAHVIWAIIRVIFFVTTPIGLAMAAHRLRSY